MKKEGLKYSCAPERGYTQIASPKNAVLRWLELGAIKLLRGDGIDLPVGIKKEAVLTLLKGKCVAEVNGQKLTLGSRKNVFEENPWAVYARGASAMRIVARSNSELLLSAASVSRRDREVRLVEPADIVNRTVGTGAYERRVRTIIGEDFPAERLLVGETLNEAGKWSSYPPHRHENNSSRESKLEEVYYYKLEKPTAFGIQRIYTDDGRIDETHAVRDGDLCVLPRGYHPVVAMPASRLYYFWALAGDRRKMRWRVDPNYARG